MPVDDAQPDALLAGTEVLSDGDGVDVSRSCEVLDPERVSRAFAAGHGRANCSARHHRHSLTSMDGLGGRDRRKRQNVTVLHVAREHLEPDGRAA